MDENDVEVLERQVVHGGHCKVVEYRLRHRRFDGGQSPVLSREVVDRGPVVAVLPVDVRRDELVLIEQFRAGAFAAGCPPWQLECVAGFIEPGETPDDVARRETMEECGRVVGRLKPIASYLSSPGGSAETVALYCAEIDTADAGGLHGLAEEGEDIKVHVYSVAGALELLARGHISNAKTFIALQWLAMHHDTLKSEWS
ncbi:MAG: NUDIX domain-containing protein [Gammaproteobacteria bacterium]|nr:NUDIX domain-containing protein [Gammaproteobacteria bacterium]